MISWLTLSPRFSASMRSALRTDLGISSLMVTSFSFLGGRITSEVALPALLVRSSTGSSLGVVGCRSASAALASAGHWEHLTHSWQSNLELWQDFVIKILEEVRDLTGSW